MKFLCKSSTHSILFAEEHAASASPQPCVNYIIALRLKRHVTAIALHCTALLVAETILGRHRAVPQQRISSRAQIPAVCNAKLI
jgi:hypothetical protein